MTPSIVCGVDQSAHARTVATFAADLATRLGLRLVLVHAVPTIAPAVAPSWPVRAPYDSSELRAAAHRAGERFLADVAGDAGVDGAVTRVEDGTAAECVAFAADQEAARFLVLGTHGRGAAGVLVTGSVSLAAIRLVSCPVIVVPEHVNGAPGAETIVCGMADGEDLEPLRVARDLASGLGLRLVPAHAVGDAGAAGVADIRRHLRDGPAILIGDPAEELVRLAEEARAAMVVVGSRGRGPLRASLLGSTSRSLARASTTPVVICPPTRYGEEAR